MNFEQFKVFIIKELNYIDEKDLINLWKIYEQYYKLYSDKADYVLDLLVFICKELKKIDITDIIFSITVMLYIKNEVYFGCRNKDYLEKIFKEHYIYCKLSNQAKLICLKYIEEMIKQEVSNEIRSNYVLTFYKSKIKKHLTNEQLNDILKLNDVLTNVGDYMQFDFGDIRDIIIDCYNNNNFSYYQSFNWCLEKITTVDINDLKKIKEEINIKTNQENLSVYDEFLSLLKSGLTLSDTKVKYLWNIYQEVGHLDYLDLKIVEIIIQAYPFMKKNNVDFDVQMIIILKRINFLFIQILPILFDDNVINGTKEFFYQFIQENCDNNTKKCCYQYVNKIINKKRNNYYDETNVEAFFYNELTNLYAIYGDEIDLKDCVDECKEIYETLIKKPYMSSIPKYVIKNAILLSHVEYPKNVINFYSRLNLSVGLSFYKYINKLEDINNIIFDHYNNKSISDIYKTVYFIYGILCFVENIKIRVNNKSSEFNDGINYYNYNQENETLFDIAINIDDYWHDLDINKHSKNFQLGIIYRGLEYYQKDLLYEEEMLNNQLLILKNNDYS